MLVQQHSEKIYQHYNSSAVATGYGQQEYLTPCERLFFDTYIKPGMAVLDIGVGGGRTSGAPKKPPVKLYFYAVPQSFGFIREISYGGARLGSSGVEPWNQACVLAV